MNQKKLLSIRYSNYKWVALMKIIIFLFLFIQISSANLTITNDTKVIDNFTISYFYDGNRTLSINDIIEKKFHKTISNQFTFGYVDGNTWFKITLRNLSKNNRFVLYFAEPFMEKFNLFSYQNNSWEKE